MKQQNIVPFDSHSDDSFIKNIYLQDTAADPKE
jgi:hypothetical protein